MIIYKAEQTREVHDATVTLIRFTRWNKVLNPIDFDTYLFEVKQGNRRRQYSSTSLPKKYRHVMPELIEEFKKDNPHLFKGENAQ